MGKGHGPNELLHSLTELRTGDARRRFRKGIFEDYPLRGPLGNCACAYCGKPEEKLTLDHVVPKSKGGAHFARSNLVPSCLACNARKSNLDLLAWWRSQVFWSEERETLLMQWIQLNSTADHSYDVGAWGQWTGCETYATAHTAMTTQKAANTWPPFLYLAAS